MASGKKSRAGYGDVELNVNERSVKDSRGSGFGSFGESWYSGTGYKVVSYWVQSILQ